MLGQKQQRVNSEAAKKDRPENVLATIKFTGGAQTSKKPLAICSYVEKSTRFDAQFLAKRVMKTYTGTFLFSELAVARDHIVTLHLRTT